MSSTLETCAYLSVEERRDYHVVRLLGFTASSTSWVEPGWHRKSSCCMISMTRVKKGEEMPRHAAALNSLLDLFARSVLVGVQASRKPWPAGIAASRLNPRQLVSPGLEPSVSTSDDKSRHVISPGPRIPPHTTGKAGHRIRPGSQLPRTVSHLLCLSPTLHALARRFPLIRPTLAGVLKTLEHEKV